MPWQYHLPWGNVDLQDPGLKVLIQHDVKTKELVTTIGPPHIHLQQAGHVGFWPGHREKGGLTQSCPANEVAQRWESRSKPEKAALKRPLMWGQLLGMDFIEEQNLILSTPSYFLRNWNSTAQSLGHSSVKPMRKEGLWWQAPTRWQCDSRDDGFDNNILYLLPYGITIDSFLAQVVPQSFQCPATWGREYKY